MPNQNTSTTITDWEEVIRDHHKGLVRFLIGILSSRERAEDVAHDTYLRFLTKPVPAYVENPRGYLFAAAHNIAINHLQQEKRIERRMRAISHHDSFSRMSYAESISEPSRAVEHDELLALVDHALSDLPKNCRAAFFMQRFQDLSYIQIAKVLGVSASMVEKYMMRTLAYCRAQLMTEVSRYREPLPYDNWSLLVDGVTITTCQLSAYRQNGLTILRSAIPSQRVTALRRAAVACCEDASVPWYRAKERDGISQFLTSFCVWRRHSIFRDLVFHSALPDVAASLLGTHGTRLFLDQLFLKPPGSYPAGWWYRDADYLPTHRRNIIGMLLPIDTAGAQAVFQWIRGSHSAYKGDTGRSGCQDEIAEFAAESSYESLSLNPGDCVLYDGRLVHRLAAVENRESIRVLTLRFVDPDAVWRPTASSVFNRDAVRASLPGASIEYGRQIGGSQFPLLARKPHLATLEA